VTGPSGLIGSEAVGHFAARGWAVHGVDNNNNIRADFYEICEAWQRRD
jgi:CDP-paratose 2-epimerase